MSNTMKIEDQERILEALNEFGLPFDGYQFTRDANGRMDRLGGGGFGSVYASKGRVEDRAIKVIGFQEPPITDSWEIEKCEKEVWIQAAVGKKCREIVQIRDVRVLCIQFDEDDNVLKATPMNELKPVDDDCGLFLFISMERLQSVVTPVKRRQKQLCPRLDPPEEPEVLKLATDIGRALRAAHTHSEKIIHRDVKLENIFWDEKIGVYKLGDFGIARATMSGGTMTRGPGTEGYVAPEVLRGNAYDVKADMYSYGIMLYRLLNELRRPLPGEQYSGKPLLPPKNGSPALQQVVLKACSYDPADRYASMDELLQALEKVRAGGADTGVSGPGTVEEEPLPAFDVTVKKSASSGLEDLPIPGVTRADEGQETLERIPDIEDLGKDDDFEIPEIDFDDLLDGDTGTVLEEIIPPLAPVPTEHSRKNAPRKDAPKKDTPKKDAPKKDAPRKNGPRKNVPKTDAPRKERPKKDVPKKDEPKTADQLFEERLNAFMAELDEESPSVRDEIKQNARNPEPKQKKPAPKQKEKKSKIAVVGRLIETVYDLLDDLNWEVAYSSVPIGILVILLAAWKHEWILPDIAAWQLYAVLALNWICSFAVKKIDDDRDLDVAYCLICGDPGEVWTVIMDYLIIGFMLFSLKALNVDWLLILLSILGALGLFAIHMHVLIGATVSTVVAVVQSVTNGLNLIPEEMSQFLVNAWAMPWVKLLVVAMAVSCLVRFVLGSRWLAMALCMVLLLSGSVVLTLTVFTEIPVPEILVELHILRTGLICFGFHTVLRWLHV